LVSFDVRFFTNVPVDEVFQVIRSLLSMGHIFVEHSILQVDDIMELLNVFMRTYFLFENKYYQQKGGVAMGSSLSPVVITF
jgi:hypothetical protein